MQANNFKSKKPVPKVLVTKIPGPFEGLLSFYYACRGARRLLSSRRSQFQFYRVDGFGVARGKLFGPSSSKPPFTNTVLPVDQPSSASEL